MVGLQAQRERDEVERRVTTGQKGRSGIDARACVDGGGDNADGPEDRTIVGNRLDVLRQIQTKITRNIQRVVIMVARLRRHIRRAGILLVLWIVARARTVGMPIVVRMPVMMVATEMEMWSLVVVIRQRPSHWSVRMRHRKPLKGYDQHQQDGKETLQHFRTHRRQAILSMIRPKSTIGNNLEARAGNPFTYC